MTGAALRGRVRANHLGMTVTTMLGPRRTIVTIEIRRYHKAVERAAATTKTPLPAIARSASKIETTAAAAAATVVAATIKASGVASAREAVMAINLGMTSANAA